MSAKSQFNQIKMFVIKRAAPCYLLLYETSTSKVHKKWKYLNIGVRSRSIEPAACKRSRRGLEYFLFRFLSNQNVSIPEMQKNITNVSL